MKLFIVAFISLILLLMTAQLQAWPAFIMGWTGAVYYMEVDVETGTERGPFVTTVRGDYDECRDRLASARRVTRIDPSKRFVRVEYCSLAYVELADTPIARFEPIFPPPCLVCYYILLSDRIKDVFPNYHKQAREVVEKYQIKNFHTNLLMLYEMYGIESFAKELDALEQKEVDLLNAEKGSLK